MHREYDPVAVLLEPAHHEAEAVAVLLVEAAVHHRRQRLVYLQTIKCRSLSYKTPHYKEASRFTKHRFWGRFTLKNKLRRIVSARRVSQGVVELSVALHYRHKDQKGVEKSTAAS